MSFFDWFGRSKAASREAASEPAKPEGPRFRLAEWAGRFRAERWAWMPTSFSTRHYWEPCGGIFDCEWKSREAAEEDLRRAMTPATTVVEYTGLLAPKASQPDQTTHGKARAKRSRPNQKGPNP